jgi:phosphate/sulfate permease
MIEIGFWIYGILGSIIALAYAHFEGRYKTIGFFGSIVIMLIFTPFFGYFIIESFSNKKAKGCKWWQQI